MRYMHYRNFYDPYEWQWQDGRSKWDLLDLTRMARALRPEGIKWPVDSEGKPANRLELLAAINKLEHTNAHDALSDVLVTIDLARLIKNKQPKLFEHLLKIRGKKEVAQLVHSNSMFVYTSGKYPSEFEKTTVVTVLAGHPTTEAAIVYDLRQGPEPFIKMAPEQLAEAWQWHPPEENYPKLPIKTIKFNRCPAVAPLSVLDSASQKRLGIDMKAVNANLDKLINFKGFVPKVLKAVEILDGQQQAGLLEKEQTVDTQLYDGFFGGQDKLAMRAVRAAQPQELADFSNKLADNRLKALLPLYQARNYPESLNIEQRAWWENYCHNKFTSGGGKSRLAQYFERLETIKQGKLNKQQQYLVTELELYGQSLM
jgi:exodeoxyribonuclease-1